MARTVPKIRKFLYFAEIIGFIYLLRQIAGRDLALGHEPWNAEVVFLTSFCCRGRGQSHPNAPPVVMQTHPGFIHKHHLLVITRKPADYDTSNLSPHRL